MNKLHIAISTNKIEETVIDYTVRLGAKPCSFIPNEYALWRTESLNVSVRQDSSCKAGDLRHLGWEDSSAKEFSQDTDVNGIVWERFSAQQQADEINEIWPEANFTPEQIRYNKTLKRENLQLAVFTPFNILANYKFPLSGRLYL